MNNLVKLIPSKDFEPLEGFRDVSSLLASEGYVLLKNEDNLLPLKKGTTVSVFGRIQFDYYKSGTGSGGLVNVDKVVSILEALEDSPLVNINKDLVKVYQNWVKENPYNAGNGMWASEPWNQKEMPLDENTVLESYKKSDVAIIIIGRTAGEDRDNWLHEGSYLLSKDEEEMIEKVTKVFKKTILLLNVGNIIDMSFEDKYHLSSIVYAWHGGENGGRSLVNLLVGDNAFSGKLVDTIPVNVEDIPSHKNFGDRVRNYYEEDIFVGYRYYETFNVKVRYPFGFGLTYSTFSLNLNSFSYENDKLNLNIKIKNEGNYKGKEVAQIYIKAPNKKLAKASKVLVGFNKSPLLYPQEEYNFDIKISEYLFASYADNGEYKSCYVLESGDYEVYLGSDVRSAEKVATFNIPELKIIRKLNEALTPTLPFKRLTIKEVDGNITPAYENVPLRSYDLKERINNAKLPILKEREDKGYKLIDVYNNKVSLEEFTNQLSNEEFATLFRGEGMSSPKVTPGCGGAIGGVCDCLLNRGIPLACVTDGPSGIRMDSGKKATSIPIGTCIASSFNLELTEAIGLLLAKEMHGYNIDTLLAPGLNIHRHPFNGRNFEYFSEDPLLAGLMAGAYCLGIQKGGHTCTLKHMICNSQETARFDADSVVSERALREIYLKPFEIAIHYSDAKVIMTSYNPINGIWAAGNYDLCTTIIREEWGFDGLIVTDWWAKMNDDNYEGSSRKNSKFMIRAQNDMYMVVGNALENGNDDNTLEGLKEGVINRAHLIRNGMNVFKYLLNTPTFLRTNKLEGTLKFNPQTYVEVNSQESHYPLIKNIKINGQEVKNFKPYVSVYYLDEKLDNNSKVEIETTANYEIVISEDVSSMRILLKENNNEFIYHFITTDPTRNYKKGENDYSLIEKQNVYDIPNNPYVKTNLSLTKLTKTSDNVVYEDGEFKVLPKGSFVTFSININEYGKYIIEFKIKTDEIGLAQIPFITYIDNENKHTLTIGDFSKDSVFISEQVLINKGVHNLTFEFNMTGLHIKEINIIKHP